MRKLFLLALSTQLAVSAFSADFLVRDDGTKAFNVLSWKPRMLEITRKFEREVFGMMPSIPEKLKMECISTDENFLNGKATLKRIKFTWPRLYDKGEFVATVVLPNRPGAMASFVLVRSEPIAEKPEPTEDWPFDELVSREYATIAFNGNDLTAPSAVDAISQRALAFRMIYEWILTEPRMEAMNTSPVGCGPLDGVSAFWASSFDWRFYCVVAAQTGLGEKFIELAANNTPGMLYTCSCTEQTKEEIANDKALAEKTFPAWKLYDAVKPLGGSTDYHCREGKKGLVREDWKNILAFTDRHFWGKSLQKKPLDSMPGLPDMTREEIVDIFRKNVYGYAPPRPADLHFVPTSPDVEIVLDDGTKVIRRQMMAKWSGKLGKGEFPFHLFIPKKAGKVPAIVGLQLRKPEIGDERKINSERWWDIEQIVKRGYAAIGVWYKDISPDSYHEFDVKPFNVFETPKERTNESWGAISAWAWGLHRIVDYIVTLPEIDSKRIIVTGHSRGGKTALWAGAQDERIALTVPLGSGRGGMCVYHMTFATPAETIAIMNSAYPYWCCGNYKKWNNRDFEIPFEQFWLVSAIAPRRIYVCEALGDATRYGDWYTLTKAAPAWEKYGMKALPVGPIPETGKPAWSEGTGFHVRTGPHSVYSYDWQEIMNYADAYLK